MYHLIGHATFKKCNWEDETNALECESCTLK
jgi:hypothetical protein